MKKLDVIILKKDVDIVLKEVVGFGNFQVLDIDAEKARGFSLVKNPSSERTALLGEYDRRAQFLQNAFKTTEAANRMEDTLSFENADDNNESSVLNMPAIEQALKGLETEYNQYNAEMEKTRTRKSDLDIRIKKIQYFSDISTDWRRFRDLPHIYIGFGVIPVTSFPGFQAAADNIPSVVYRQVGIEGRDVLLFFAASRTVREKMDSILKNVYFRDYGIPDSEEGAAGNNLMKLAFDLSGVHDEELWLDRRFEKLAARGMVLLRRVRKSVHYHIGMVRLEEEMASTGKAILFSGWVPASQADDLRALISKVTEGRSEFVTTTAAQAFAEEGLEPPTKLDNPAILRPFELLVTTFGTPSYSEIDPTPFAALTYMIMYGAMFGDIGHGFVIALLGVALLLFKKFRGMASFGAILTGIGLSSMVFGVLYGEMFGKHTPFQAIWMNPAQNMMEFLLMGVIFGAIMITFGIILNLVNSALEKNWGKFFFSPSGLAGIILYMGILANVALPMLKLPYSSMLWFMPISGAFMILFEKPLEGLFIKSGHKEKGSAVKSFFELFEALLGFFSNTLSYIRVAAFALNHSVLMGVVYLLADGVKNNPVGYSLAVIGGNLFIIGFEGLIVGIQSLRLEYYEFFTRFFRASGQKFEGLGIYKNRN